MPACRLTKTGKHSGHLLWRITESEKLLVKNSTAEILDQPAYKRLSHPRKRREWLAARLALQQLLTELGYEHTKLKKEVWGQPHLVSDRMHLSITHCASYAVAAVDQESPVGIDIQLPCKKLQNVKEKFLSDVEIKDSGNDPKKLGIYWCAKEAIYKTLRGNLLSLKRDIFIQNFTKADQDVLWGRAKNQWFMVHYSFYDQHVLAWSRAS